MNNDFCTHEFFYDLPKELIAQQPIEPRDSSRMLVYDKATSSIRHKHFYDIVDLLQKGDVIVLNNTKVIPARIFGTRVNKESISAQKNTEILLLKRLNNNDWECIARPAKKLKLGTKIHFGDDLQCEIIGFGEEGIRIVRFEFQGIFEEILDKLGNMPLPPYITETLQDKTRYQTIYSKYDGSSAAPTAGLHFTQELLDKIQQKGIEIANVLLHVGLGTFRPVKEENILQHKMHSEYYEIDQKNAEILNKATIEGRRIVCVGTTSVRVLESVADDNGMLKASKGNTQIFIYPGYKFKVTKALITNFHLPESTLIMLVSAFLGKEQTLDMYKQAVKEKYRFFSFGDSTFLY